MMHRNEINFVAIDFETATNNRMPCQLGIAVVENGTITEKKEYLFRPPDNRYDAGCIRVHKITPSHTENCEEFSYYWEDIKSYLHHGVVVVHNYSFDIDVLDRVCNFYDLNKAIPMAIMDTCSIFNDRSLDDVCHALGINFTNHHHAKYDAIACAEIFLSFLNGADPNIVNTVPRKIRQKNNFGYNPSTEQIQKVALSADVEITSENLFFEKSFVLSGNFERYSRDDLSIILEKLGGIKRGSISGKTHFFIAGTAFGPEKMNKVMEMQKNNHPIKIINENILYEILSKLI